MIINVEVADPYSVGNIAAILSEIASRLGTLADGGETSLIDLKSLPLSSGEYEHLRFTLGRGEVTASLDAIGMSEIVETQFSGVWWITHYNDQGDIVADLIEIATIPNILLSQPEDMRTGLALLHAIISRPASSHD